jgi:hypothetical protein
METDKKFLFQKLSREKERKLARQKHDALFQGDQHCPMVSMCPCSVCQRQAIINDHKPQLSPEDFSDYEYTLHQETEKSLEEKFGDNGYLFMLRLMTCNQNNKGIDVLIPETVIFIQGTTKLHVTVLPDEVRCIRPRETYTTTNIRKIFVDKDYQNQKELMSVKAAVSPFTNPNPAPKLTLPSSHFNISTPPSPTHSKTPDHIPSPIQQQPANQVEDKDRSKFSRPFVFIYTTTDRFPKLITYEGFIEIVELRKTHKMWMELRYIQSAKLKNDLYIDPVRVKFDIAVINPAYLKRTDLRQLIREGKVPDFIENYISDQAEKEFMAELKQASLIEYCRYLCCKIYSFVSYNHRIFLEKFIADFLNDGTNLWFCGGRMIDVSFHNIEDSINSLSMKKPEANPADKAVATSPKAEADVPLPRSSEDSDYPFRLHANQMKEEQKKQLILEMELISEYKGKSLFSFKKVLAKRLPSVEPSFQLSNHKRLGNIFTTERDIRKGLKEKGLSGDKSFGVSKVIYEGGGSGEGQSRSHSLEPGQASRQFDEILPHQQMSKLTFHRSSSINMPSNTKSFKENTEIVKVDPANQLSMYKNSFDIISESRRKITKDILAPTENSYDKKKRTKNRVVETKEMPRFYQRVLDTRRVGSLNKTLPVGTKFEVDRDATAPPSAYKETNNRIIDDLKEKSLKAFLTNPNYANQLKRSAMKGSSAEGRGRSEGANKKVIFPNAKEEVWRKKESKEGTHAMKRILNLTTHYKNYPDLFD